MNRAKLGKLRRELLQMRRSPQKAADLESLARRLGRVEVKRGKEPVWDSKDLELYPVAIPHHGGKDLAPGTKNNILDSLEHDIYAWEEKLEQEELEQDEDGSTDDERG